MKTSAFLCVVTLVVFQALLLMAPAGAYAGVVTNTLDDGSDGCLRSIIDAASSGDTITFDEDLFDSDGTLTITLPEANAAITIDKSLTITTNNANLTVVLTHTNGRVFGINGQSININSNGANESETDGITVKLEYLQFKNCGSSTLQGGGGAFYAGTANLTVSNCSFVGNQAELGGAIYLEEVTATIEKCDFDGNITLKDSDSYLGGAIYATNLYLTIDGCSFENNESYYGGALYLSGEDKSSTIKNSSFYMNTGYGANSICLYVADNITLENLILYKNSSSTVYGDITIIYGDNISIASCTIVTETLLEEDGNKYSIGLSWLYATTGKVVNTIISGAAAITVYEAGAFTDGGGNVIGGTVVFSQESFSDSSIFNDTAETLGDFTWSTVASGRANIGVLLPSETNSVVNAGVVLDSSDSLYADTSSDIRGKSRGDSDWDAGAVELLLPTFTYTSATRSGTSLKISYKVSESDVKGTYSGYLSTSSDPASDENAITPTSTDYASETSTLTLTFTGVSEGTDYYVEVYMISTSGITYTSKSSSTSGLSDSDDSNDGNDGNDGDGDDSQAYDDSLVLWHNVETGKLYYWMLNAQGKLPTDMAGTSGLISETETLPEDWQIERQLRVGDETLLLIRNTESGLVGFWRIGSDGKLVYGTLELVSQELTISSEDWSLAGAVVINDAPMLFWQKGDSTELRVWRLTEDCALIDAVEGSGWGKVAPNDEIRSPWKALTVSVKDGEPYVWWRNTDTNRIAYWRLDDEGLLLESSADLGWSWVNGDLSLTANWTFVDVMEINGITTLFWRNQNTGKVACWHLDDENILPNSTVGDGWDFVLKTNPSTDWEPAGGFTFFDTPALLWFNESTGRVALWLLDDSGTYDSWNWVYSGSVASRWQPVDMDE